MQRRIYLVWAICGILLPACSDEEKLEREAPPPQSLDRLYRQRAASGAARLRAADQPRHAESAEQWLGGQESRR